MTNRHNQSDSGPDPLIIFVVLSSLLVVTTLIAFGALIIISASQSSGSTSTEFGPYNVAQRPIPNVPDPSRLLPATLSDFKRKVLSGGGQDYKATYLSGSNQIVIAISEGVSLRVVQAYVSTAAQTVKDAKITNSVLSGDPSYFVATGTDSTSTRLVWSHDRWFFDVTANSQPALDAFMKVFKY